MRKEAKSKRSMPLPKSSSIVAKATEVYTEAWSVILQQIWGMAPTREDDLSNLSRLLPYLRQLLTCCACAGLLEEAMISPTCGHCYCCQCQFKDPVLKIQCRQCRDRTGLIAEAQLRIVVKCYRHMCSIVAEKISSNPDLLKNLSVVVQTEEKVVLLANKNNENQSNDELKTSKCTDSNPVVEILREVEEGVKISRAVLVVKPPQKYLFPKQPTPKKIPSNVSKPKPKCATDLSSEFSEEGDAPVSTERTKRAPQTSTLISHRISGARGKRKRRNILGAKSVQSSPTIEPRKRQRVQSTPKAKLDTSTEEDEEVDIMSVTETKPPANEIDLIGSKLTLDTFDQNLYSVSLTCLNEKFINISESVATLRQNSTTEAFHCEDNYKPDQLNFRRRPDGSRERLWNHMCPRVKTRRSRAIIDKTITQQVKVARGAIRTKSKEIKLLKLVKVKPPPNPVSVTSPPIPTPTIDYEPPLPDDLSGLVLEKLEGEDPLPHIDRLLFRPPPMFHPPPHFHPHSLPPPPPHFGPAHPPLYGPMHSPGPQFPLMIQPVTPLKPHFPTPIPKSGSKTLSKSPVTPKKRRTPGYSEEGWRCRCGTNNVMFPEKVCAKGKCPCFSKGIPCKNCLCKHCHNPNNN